MATIVRYRGLDAGVGPDVSLDDLPDEYVFDAATAYDFGAAYYDDWRWQQVWKAVEWPHIENILRETELSFGAELLRVLDIGVGTGRNLEKLVKSTRCNGDVEIGVWGIDISKRMIERARENLDRENVSLSLRCGDARKLTTEFEDEYFGIVLLCRVASHLPEIDSFAHELCRILRPGGVIIVSDVDPQHCYTRTRLPCRDRKISVETYKHSLDDWRVRLEQNGLRIGVAKHITTNDVRRNVPFQIPRSIGSLGAAPVSFIVSGCKPLN